MPVVLRHRCVELHVLLYVSKSWISRWQQDKVLRTMEDLDACSKVALCTPEYPAVLNGGLVSLCFALPSLDPLCLSSETLLPLSLPWDKLFEGPGLDEGRVVEVPGRT